MHYYDQIVNYIKSVFNGPRKDGELRHLERTVYWLKKLKPEADEALMIAAYSHDVERAFRDKNYSKISKSAKGFFDPDHLKHHQETGANIIDKFLEEIGAPEDMRKKVWGLISRHEIGGSEEANVLKDADTISFFENNVEHFISSQVKQMGKEKVLVKFKWMYERITSPVALEIAEPMYQKAIKRLEE